MSLACNECGLDIRPSDSLPGREGVFIHPVALSIVWTPNIPDNLDIGKTALVYIRAPHNRSCCFQCISERLPEAQKSLLETVYDAYVAEERYWLGHEQPADFKVFARKYELIPKNKCIFCNGDVRVARMPYFTAIVINKTYSQAHTSLFGSYSWSNIQKGMTYFEMCFECFRINFSRSFEQLGYDLHGLDISNLGEVVKTEFYFSSEVIEALKEEFGDEEAQEILRRFSRTVQD